MVSVCKEQASLPQPYLRF